WHLVQDLLDEARRIDVLACGIPGCVWRDPRVGAVRRGRSVLQLAKNADVLKCPGVRPAISKCRGWSRIAQGINNGSRRRSGGRRNCGRGCRRVAVVPIWKEAEDAITGAIGQHSCRRAVTNAYDLSVPQRKEKRLVFDDRPTITQRVLMLVIPSSGRHRRRA